MNPAIGRRATSLLVWIGLLVALLSTPVAAWDPGLSMMQSNLQNMNNSAMINVQTSTFCSAFGQCGSGQRAAGAAPVASAEPVDLSLARDAEVTAMIEAEILEGARQRDPSAAAELEVVFANYDVVDLFAGAVAPFGLGASSLEDTLAAFWVLVWLVANETPADPAHYPDPAAVQAVRDQLHGALSTDPALAALDERERQIFGESLIYNYVLLVAGWEEAGAPGNAPVLSELAAVWRAQGERLFGVDPLSLALTTQGFEPQE